MSNNLWVTFKIFRKFASPFRVRHWIDVNFRWSWTLIFILPFSTGCVDKERKLDTLRKKEVDNISDYFARKEDRIGKKKGKSATEDNTRTESLHTACEEITESHEAKRPRLET